METNEEYLENEANEPNDYKYDQEFTDDGYMEDEEVEDKEDMDIENYELIKYEEREKYYRSNGYMLAAEGEYDDLDNWYVQKLEDHYEEIKDLIDKIKWHLNKDVVEEIYMSAAKAKFSCDPYWYYLDTIEGAEIEFCTPNDRYVINMLVPRYWVKKELVDEVCKEYENLVKQFVIDFNKSPYKLKLDKAIKKQEKEEKKREREEEEKARVLEMNRLENERKAKELVNSQLSMIAEYFLNPQTPVLVLGPVHCYKHGKISIAMEYYKFRYYVPYKYQDLVKRLQEIYDVVKTHNGRQVE